MSAAAQRPRIELLYYFCRLQLPAINLPSETCQKHLERTFAVFSKKQDTPVVWDTYLDNLYPLDWFVAAACLENHRFAWEHLFASRAGRSDCLLMDALRSRATRLYPRDEERQDSAVSEFWSSLIASANGDSLPILARYDGQRPLVPWLIRVFQNWHISQLRRNTGTQALPDDEIGLPMPEPQLEGRWREAFALAVQDWLTDLNDDEILLLGLRFRHRLSQREVANFLKVHEGTISRRTDALRDQCLEMLSRRLTDEGWTGDDVFALIRTEMHNLLLDDPRLSVDNLAHIMAKKGKKLP